jgi:osmotically inducible lipoprotein OsmB
MTINIISMPLALLTVVILLTACGTSNTDRALSGGAIGAGVGAVGSSVTGGSPWTGAAIGGAVGAATGVLTKKK